jgi:hypothetical protein
MLVFLSTACSQNQDPAESWQVDGQPVPDSDWYKTDPPFAAQLMVIDSQGAPDLYDRWENVPGGVHVWRLERVKAGTRIETVVFFAGCAGDLQGNCLVEAQGRISTGAGRVLIENAPIVLSDKPVPEGKNLGISENGLTLEALLSHKYYEFEMRVVDRIARREVVLTQKIEVLE